MKIFLKYFLLNLRVRSFDSFYNKYFFRFFKNKNMKNWFHFCIMTFDKKNHIHTHTHTLWSYQTIHRIITEHQAHATNKIKNKYSFHLTLACVIKQTLCFKYFTRVNIFYLSSNCCNKLIFRKKNITFILFEKIIFKEKHVHLFIFTMVICSKINHTKKR